MLLISFALREVYHPPGNFSILNLLLHCPSVLPCRVYSVQNHEHCTETLCIGLSNTQWEDCLSCIDFDHGQTSAVCYREEFIVVSFTKGTVALYHATTCQEQRVFTHGEVVRFLKFTSMTNLLALCGLRTIRIWDIGSGETIHIF